MDQPTLNYIDCPDSGAGHRMAYWQWGAPDAAHAVFCVHGLTRQGRDFDALARGLVASSRTSLRVICPDIVGRGQSSWLADPMAYAVPTYAADMLHLLRQLQPQQIDWVGTSMGGLIGMALCTHAASQGLAFRRLVLNDVGPVLEWRSLQRIAAYVGRNMAYDSMEEAVEALWQISHSFGPHTPHQWQELSRHMVRSAGDGAPPGSVRLHYDPAIGTAFAGITPEQSAQGEAVLWSLYDAITTPTLLLRGAESDLLSAQTAALMQQRGPRARLVEFAGVGHAPTLVAPEQQRVVCDFLLAEA